ncbi:MAG: glycosyltransferase family 87 protein [Candidatus Limnocylindrales bacterium]|jgi:alpha-1,2-mannosyltransferase
MTRARAFEISRLALAAAAIALAGWLFWALALHLGPNDFHDYWLAGKLLLEGHSPYDTQAMAELAKRENLTFLVGGGYSYPLPFALAMVPFAMLPFGVAVATFNVVSLVAFGLTVAAWLVWTDGWAAEAARRRLALAFAAGFYPPIYGTVAMGQANLVLFPLLAVGTVLVLDGATSTRRLAGGVLVGLAAIVKLVPGVLFFPLTLGRRFGAAAGIAVGAFGALAVAAAALPWAAAGSGDLASLLDPDAYYTNQSINGFVTRLVASTGKSVALWTDGFDPQPVMLAATIAFGLATLAVLWWARAELRTRRGSALGLGLALVAGIIGAPKTSFWNESIVLIAIGALLAVDASDLRLERLGRIDCALLGTWLGSAIVWAAVWAAEPQATGPLSAAVTLLWSASLYGLLALWLLFVRRLLAARRIGLQEAAAQAAASSPTLPSTTS